MDSPRSRLEHLVRAHGRRAWTVAWSLLRDAHEAHDAVQQALLVAARKADRIPADGGWPWFGVVVAHEARNLRRKRRPLTNQVPETGPMTPSQIPDPTRETQRREDHGRLRSALGNLPAAERDALSLTQLAGMTHAAAAEALALPRKTVTAQVRRGLQRLGRQLGREPASVSGALALLPVAPPVGGWEVALSSWTHTALTISGVTLMTSKTVLALSIAVALGVGFLGGSMAVRHGDLGAPDASTAEHAPAQQGGDAIDSGPLSLSSSATDDVQIASLRRKVATLQARLAEREASASDGQAGEAISGPTFTFGELGRLPAIRQADWQQLARASNVVQACVLELHEYAKRGEKAPREVYLRLQQNNERVRTYEYETIGKIPTAAKNNGELTHPLTMANLIAAALVEAGLPLEDDQVKRIAALGDAFDEAFAEQRRRFPESTPTVARILAEYRLKGRFTADLAKALTPEQRDLVFDPATRGMAGLDLYSPTLLILHTSPMVVGKSGEAIAAKVADILAKKLALEGADREELDRAVEAWRQDVVGLLDPVSPPMIKHYSYAQGEVAAEATVRLTTRLLRDLRLPEEQRKALLADFAIYVPRVVEP